MAVIYMKRTSKTGPIQSAGALYTKKIVLTAGESDVFILPITQIYSIAVSIDGDGTIAFSNDGLEDLEAGNGAFIVWDGTSLINLGLTAFKAIWGSGTTTIRITIKTATE